MEGCVYKPRNTKGCCQKLGKSCGMAFPSRRNQRCQLLDLDTRQIHFHRFIYLDLGLLTSRAEKNSVVRLPFIYGCLLPESQETNIAGETWGLAVCLSPGFLSPGSHQSLLPCITPELVQAPGSPVSVVSLPSHPPPNLATCLFLS